MGLRQIEAAGSGCAHSSGGEGKNQGVPETPAGDERVGGTNGIGAVARSDLAFSQDQAPEHLGGMGRGDGSRLAAPIKLNALIGPVPSSAVARQDLGGAADSA